MDVWVKNLQSIKPENLSEVDKLVKILNRKSKKKAARNAPENLNNKKPSFLDELKTALENKRVQGY